MGHKTISTKLAAVVVALVLLCCSTMIISTSVRAQTVSCLSCPVPTDDANNVGGTAGVPWTGGHIDTTIFGCPVQICYGCRCSNPPTCTNYDYVVTQICVDSICFYSNDSLVLGHSDTNWDDWLSMATFELFKKNPCGFPCPACPYSGTMYWQENYMSCWETIKNIDGSGNTWYSRQFCQEHGWCLNKYEICCDATGFHHHFVSSQAVFYQCKSPCNQFSCPSPWPNNDPQ